MKKLTQKQLAFVIEYLNIGNRVEAYRRAYDCRLMAKATISRKAQEVAAIPHVAAEIKRQQETKLARHHDLADEVIGALKGIAFVDVTDYVWFDGERAWIKDAKLIPPNMRSRIKCLRVNKRGFSIVLHNPIRALELLGNYLGLFNREDLQQATKPFTINVISANSENVTQEVSRK